jgi:hypothetical protein
MKQKSVVTRDIIHRFMTGIYGEDYQSQGNDNCETHQAVLRGSSYTIFVIS